MTTSSGARSGRSDSGTVDKAIDVLFHLHREPTPHGVTDVGRALGLPKSSAHRLLSTLARRGLVERDGRGRYRLGAALVTLGLGVLDGDPLLAAARPALEREAAALGETCFLVVARAGRLVVVDKVEGTGFLRASPQVGTEVPAHATAVGKLYHAFAPELLDPAETGPFTEHTLGAEAFREHVEEVARRGFASNRDEWIDGLSVVAVPIEVHGGLRGAIALAAASARLEALGGEGIVPLLLAAAELVAARLTDVPEAAPARAARSQGESA